MPRVNKIKRDKAISALKAAGMAPSTAARYVRMLDLDKPLAEQIASLAEDLADLFDASPEDADPDEDETPMSAREAQRARLRGGSEHIQRKTFRRTATERPSTASKAAREAAEHITKNTTKNAPPTRKWIEPVRDINTPVPQRERSSSADALAARLKGDN